MTIAIIIAGGSGTRMGFETPKQFLEVDRKPVLVYTLESFQRHADIDAIEVVCIDGWQDRLRKYGIHYGISKLRWIATGGNSAQESIRNGLEFIHGTCGADDLVVVHDGIRPLVDEFVLSDVIRVCRLHGNAVTALPYNEQIFVASDAESTTAYVPRETIRRVSTPQAYHYGELADAYRKAFETGVGIGPSSYANTMMVDLGYRLWFAAGSDKNIKLTTKDDLELFKGYLASRRERNDP